MLISQKSPVANCSLLRDLFNNTLYISKLEVSFPIAFLFVVYESPEQFLRLLKVLYRPHNVYCIHPDIKSKYHQFFTSIAECFPNIIISKHLFNVTREGNSTVVMAQRSCYTDRFDSLQSTTGRDREMTACHHEPPNCLA